MRYDEVLRMLNRLPNFSEPLGRIVSGDRSWLLNFRMRFAAGDVPTIQDEQRLVRIVTEWDEA